jgi:diguanylate cyclase (GGDEF)-like protein
MKKKPKSGLQDFNIGSQFSVVHDKQSKGKAFFCKGYPIVPQGELTVPDQPRILIVNDSCVERASLSQQLKEIYEIREENDGESAWQSLVLDHTIAAVISDLQMPILDGLGLLERIRACRLSRLRGIPFILISSDEDQEVMEKAGTLGVSDFIGKGINASELKTRLHNLLQHSLTRRNLEEPMLGQARDAKTGLFTRRHIELQTAQALSHAIHHNTSASLMIIGFDNYPLMVEQVGETKAMDMGVKFAKKVAGKVRHEDYIGHFSPGRFAIISPGTPPEACVTFADRLRHAVREAVVSIGGRRMPLTMSIGIASIPKDDVDSAEALMDLSYRRMEKAIAAGGNRTEYGHLLEASPLAAPLTVTQALALLLANRSDSVIAQLPNLGRQILPLLLLMQRELDVELPINALTKKLAEREQAEKPG